MRKHFLLPLIVAIVMMAMNPVRVFADDGSSSTKVLVIKNGESVGTEYDDLETAFANVEDNCTVKLQSNQDLTADYYFGEDDFTIDLNSYSINGQDGDGYFSLEVQGSLTIKNGICSASINNANVGFPDILTLDNVTLNVSSFQWMANGVVNLINAKINFDGDGYGNFALENFAMDATSTVKLTGVNGIGRYGNMPGGYKQLVHRITVPDGYVMKRPFSDKNLAFFSVDDLDNSADMSGVTITVLGSTSLSPCEFDDFDTAYDGETGEPYYMLCCTRCFSPKEGSEIKKDGNGDYVTEDYTLDDNKDFNLPFDFTAKSFTYQREVSNGHIITILLPVALPLSEINGVVWKYNTYADGKFKFAKVTSESTEPYVPYIVVPNKEATQLLKNAVNTVLVKHPSDDVQPILTGADGESQHVGTVTTQGVVSNVFESYYGYSKASNLFVKAKTGTLKPFRTMFHLTNSADSYTYSAIAGSWTSTNTEDESESWSGEYTVTAQAGDVFSFGWTTSSEYGYDVLQAQVLAPSKGDYEKFFEASGDDAGEEHYTMTKAGTYKFKFGYCKDSSGNSGSDQVSVSDLKHYTAKSSATEAKQYIALQLGMDDDEETSIIMVDADAIAQQGSPIYNLQGMRISNPRKGQLYIQNGKKRIY